METHKKHQKALGNQPNWRSVRTNNAKEPHELTVTHINQTKDLFRAEGLDPQFSEGQSSHEWLRSHCIESMHLTLKDLVNKGKVCRPKTDQETGKRQQHLQFEAVDINEFEYKLNMAIDMFTQRIKWLLQGSKRIFGMVKGERVGVLIDCSDSNFGFGRQTSFNEALMHLVDEQLAKKKAVYSVCFGTSVVPLWKSTVEIRPRTVDELKEWVQSMKPLGGCNLLGALKHIMMVKDIDTVAVILGSVPDQASEVLCNYIEQLGVGSSRPLYTIAYDCSNQQANVTLRKLAEDSNGNYHCYATASEEQIYTGTDISLLLKEVQNAQTIINKIKEMRSGLLGTALVSVLDEITQEVSKLPQSRFLPRPPGHENPLVIEMPKFHTATSSEWLSKNGLKAKNLDLYQVLAPNAFSYREEFIPVIRKTVQSQVHEKAMAQFQWHDGTMKNIHVDMTQLFEYQKQLGATVKLFEKRVDWLSSASRKIFGTITEKNVIIMVDFSSANAKYLVHIQHSLRLLLQQQMSNKEYFNIIGYGGNCHSWQPTMVKPTPDNLQKAWKWILDQQCNGSRNFMKALRTAVENDEEAKHHVEVEGIYLFTSGIPDQSADLCFSYVEEACSGRNMKVHVVLFNVDDYDAQGAIPSRYANITKTAEVLRTMAHSSGGRFHWFRETGIIESDDIATVSLEIEKALNFSKKCAFLVESVKKKYNIMLTASGEKPTPTLPTGTMLKALPPPQHTLLSQSRMVLLNPRVSVRLDYFPSRPRPTSASSTSSLRPQTAKDPMQRVKSKKVQQQFFFVDGKAEIGAVFKNYPNQKSVRKGIKLTTITDKEDQISSKDWLRMYSLSKLKLDLNKLVSGPDCRHSSRPILINPPHRTCNIFPTVNIQGTLKHLQLLPHELIEFEEQAERVLIRYLKRLQWLLSGSRRIFGTVIEKRCVFLIDTSGSMMPYIDEVKKDLASLIWDQLYKFKVKFNLVGFSKSCEQWQSCMVEPTEDNCHDAIKWLSLLIPNGNTCTLEALQMAFRDKDVAAIYLLTDGKPDTSTSLVLRKVAEMNESEQVVVNTISFNCDDRTANSFLKRLSKETNGRYHQLQSNFDAQLYAHKLLSEGFKDPEHPALPEFESDDLRRLGDEIAQARRFLAQSKAFRAMYDLNEERPTSTKHDCFMVGQGAEKKTAKN
ncbi:hypothetical protein CAPTEDRAFT_167235 [Capitella teleta]|uniref:VWFA domain-containing protein n=1 Tax=Capitella teleta TaxID=283909 RepID=R7UPE8_CAPTE|nr:hypothetical protein CAPTEDRAFT_167235 [Capitella teleta]|eukprot:ELU05822.1 hypothetical protein CAPTEDRAFT_167235 [Capitella teleta]